MYCFGNLLSLSVSSSAGARILVVALLLFPAIDARAEVKLYPGAPICKANVGRNGGQESQFDLDTNSARSRAEGGAAGSENSSFAEVGVQFRAAATISATLSMGGIWPRGKLEGFGNINEGSYTVRVFFREVGDAAEEVQQVFHSAENGAVATKKTKVVNEVLAQGNPSFNVNLVGGRLYEMVMRLDAKANGLIGLSDFFGGDAQVTFGCIVATATDTDGDGLPDQWEQNGIDVDGDGTIDFSLQAAGMDFRGVAIKTDPLRKDVLVEVDYFDCTAAGGDCAAADTHIHVPTNVALETIRQSFANAPVINPDGSFGVNLWVQVDERLPHQQFCDLNSTCFDNVKLGAFGTFQERGQVNAQTILEAKRQAFHYNLWIHNLSATSSSSGRAERGNDFVVSLGSFTSQVGTDPQQAGTFMHELGHNLGLRHGGVDGKNCKPNHLSIMSYAWQTIGLQPSGVFDYSRQTLPSLDEASLNESLGIQDGGFTTTFGPVLNSAAGSGPIDWNLDGDGADAAVVRDINNLGIRGCGPSPGQLLVGSDDWTSLRFNFRDSEDFEEGMHVTASEEELDFESAQRIELAAWRAKTKTIYEYSVKFVCGVQGEAASTQLARGLYATTVNLHNPNDRVTTFFRKLALAYPPRGEEPGKIIELGLGRLRYDEAMKVDCETVRERAFGGKFPSGYIDGFLVIQSEQSIDVTAVYSTSALDAAGAAASHSSIDVEPIRERVRRVGLPDLVPAPALPRPSANAPEGSPGILHCVKGANGGSDAVRVNVVNKGVVESGASMLTIDFKNVGPKVVPVPMLEPGASTTVNFPIPKGCFPGTFSGKCSFRFTVDSFGQVRESEEGNNTLDSFCTSPAG